jgi:hypothetical protein
VNLVDKLRKNKVKISELDFSLIKKELENFILSLDEEFNNSTLLSVGAKFLYFLNHSIVYLGGKTEKSINELEENLLVKIEINLQLLSAQIVRVVSCESVDKNYQQSVLASLLEKIYLESVSVLSNLEIKFIQNKQQKLSEDVGNLISFLLKEIDLKSCLDFDPTSQILRRIDL